MFGLFKKKEEKILYPQPEVQEFEFKTFLNKDTPLKEKDDEHTFLWEKNVQLCYLKMVSKGYIGGSVKTFGSARLYYGNQLKSQELVQEGIGDLFLTNQRLVFIGSFNTFEIPLKKINAVHKFIDGYLSISITGKPKNPLFFLREKIYLWAATIDQMDEVQKQTDAQLNVSENDNTKEMEATNNQTKARTL